MDERPTTYSTCTGPGCGQLMLWVVTIGGKRMPLDPEPADDGNVHVTRLDDGTIRGRVLTGAELPAEGLTVYRPHHRTCVAAAEFRRRKASSGPQCRAGDGPLSPWLSDRGRWWHVGCEPVTAAELAIVLTPMPAPPRTTSPAPAPEQIPGIGGTR